MHPFHSLQSQSLQSVESLQFLQSVGAIPAMTTIPTAPTTSTLSTTSIPSIVPIAPTVEQLQSFDSGQLQSISIHPTVSALTGPKSVCNSANNNIKYNSNLSNTHTQNIIGIQNMDQVQLLSQIQIQGIQHMQDIENIQKMKQIDYKQIKQMKNTQQMKSTTTGILFEYSPNNNCNNNCNININNHNCKEKSSMKLGRNDNKLTNTSNSLNNCDKQFNTGSAMVNGNDTTLIGVRDTDADIVTTFTQTGIGTSTSCNGTANNYNHTNKITNGKNGNTNTNDRARQLQIDREKECDLNPFGVPLDENDKRWKWRESLQALKLSNNSLEHVLDLLPCIECVNTRQWDWNISIDDKKYDNCNNGSDNVRKNSDCCIDVATGLVLQMKKELNHEQDFDVYDAVKGSLGEGEMNGVNVYSEKGCICTSFPKRSRDKCWQGEISLVDTLVYPTSLESIYHTIEQRIKKGTNSTASNQCQATKKSSRKTSQAPKKMTVSDKTKTKTKTKRKINKSASVGAIIKEKGKGKRAIKIETHNNNNNNNNNSHSDVPYTSCKSLRKIALKFGCPKHDLVKVLRDSGYIITGNNNRFALCNGYSPLCAQNHPMFSYLTLQSLRNNSSNSSNSNTNVNSTQNGNISNGNNSTNARITVNGRCMRCSMVSNESRTDCENSINNRDFAFGLTRLNEWSFYEMGITSDMFPKPDKPFMIDIEYKNGSNEHILFDILRADDAAFVKRVRPGTYKFNNNNNVNNENINPNYKQGSISTLIKDNINININNQKSKYKKDHKLGTWVCRI